MFKIGIVDSGINPTIEFLETQNLRLDVINFSSGDGTEDKCGHGTAVFNAIAPGEVHCAIAKVFDDALTCSTQRIVRALEWMNDQQVGLLNLSFGLTRYDADLAEIIDTISASGTIIFASAPAQGVPVYPSAFEQVVSATGDARCDRHEWSFLNSSRVMFGAYPGDPKRGIVGSSIGCATMTGNALRLMQQQGIKNREDLIQQLSQRATYFGREYRRSI